MSPEFFDMLHGKFLVPASKTSQQNAANKKSEVRTITVQIVHD
jgi:hypothetical protein